jgi:hypothetical protein
MREINKIILHCSASRCNKDFDVNDIKEWHLQRGFTDVGYHYIIVYYVDYFRKGMKRPAPIQAVQNYHG